MNRHEKRKIQTQKKLQEAALELVLDGGYDRLSIQEITDRADLGRGTFYLYFKDKEDVIWSIIKEGIDAEDRAAHVDFGDNLPDKAECRSRM